MNSRDLIQTSVPGVSINPNTSVEELKQIPHIPINRDFASRVKKMRKHFTKGTKGIHEYTLFNVTRDLKVPVGSENIDVNAGLYVSDGNTRLESQRTNEIASPNHGVISIIMEIDSEQQMLDEYYGIDSSAATELSSDIIRGALSFLDVKLNSTKGKKGGFASALKSAYPGDPKDSVLTKVQYFKRELELLDRCGIFNTTESTLQHQHFYCACLMAAKLYSNNINVLTKTLESLSRLTAEDLKTSDQKWNGITAMIYTMCIPDRKKWIPVEYVNTTKMASWDPAMSFYLYCFENQIEGKLLDHRKGFRGTNWEGKFNQTKTLLGNTYPTL